MAPSAEPPVSAGSTRTACADLTGPTGAPNLRDRRIRTVCADFPSLTTGGTPRNSPDLWLRGTCGSVLLGAESERAGAEHELLLEREVEVGVACELIAEVKAGAGAFALVVGPAGVGKTRLLRETLVRELERDFAFGVVRQLFEPKVSGTAPAAGAGCSRMRRSWRRRCSMLAMVNALVATARMRCGLVCTTGGLFRAFPSAPGCAASRGGWHPGRGRHPGR